MCDASQIRWSFPKPISVKPIVSIGFLTRLQADLIDMQSLQYNGYDFIMHCKEWMGKGRKEKCRKGKISKIKMSKTRIWDEDEDVRMKM
jgi:hypothetical protein